MIAKCNLCGNTFNAQRSTAKFCCDLHRTLFGKLSTEEKAEKLKQLDTSLKSASEIPVPEKEKTKNSYTWVEEIENFCNQEGILPQDLITIYKSKKTKVLTPPIERNKFHDFTQDKSYAKPYSPFDNPIFKSKMSGTSKFKKD